MFSFRQLLLPALLLCSGASFAQQLTLGKTPYLMSKSAVLELNADNQGLLLPRIADTTSINSLTPPDGMIIYFTPLKQLLLRANGHWQPLPVASSLNNYWNINGNAGINSSNNFLGTIDDKALILKSNNAPFVEMGRRHTLGLVQSGFPEYTDSSESVLHMKAAVQFYAPAAQFYKPKIYADAAGNFRTKGSSAGTDFFEFGATGTNNDGGFEFIIGDDGDEPILFKSYHHVNGMSEIMRLQNGRMAVGSNQFNSTNPEKLLIDAGATTSYNLMTGKGSIDNYLQINVKNSSATANASSDIVATADNGTETVNYIDMGINSSAYSNTTYPVIGGANNAYLYSTGNDFIIGNATAGKPLRFFTGGYAAANERLRIDGSGNVGIGNTSPSQKLDVTGNVRFSGALMPGGQAGTMGSILVSSGSNTIPTWQDGTNYLNTNAWVIGGNTTTTIKNFGTVSNYALPFITNNTERMRIATNGNVGIGTANPAEKFEVDGTVLLGSTGQNGRFKISNTTATNFLDMYTEDDVTVKLSNAGNGQTGASLQLKPANQNYLFSFEGRGGFRYYSRVSNGETFKVDDTGEMSSYGTGNNYFAGKLGIGTSSPSEKLDVNGNLKFSGALMPNNAAGTAGYLLQSNGAGAAPTWVSAGNSASWALDGNSVSSIKTLGTASNYALPFITNNTERMRIAAGGNVGIGTANPSEKFEVDGNVLLGSTAQNGRLKFSNTLAAGSPILYTDDDVILRFSNGGNTNNGASLQLKSSVQNYLFSFEGHGGFRYWSRVSGAEKFKVEDTGEMTSFGTGTNLLYGKLGVGGTLSDAYSFVELKKAFAAGTDSVLLTLNSNNGSLGGGSSLQYKNTGAGYLSAIAGIDDGSYNGRLEFRTNNTAGARTTPLTSSDNKMVLSSNGNLGIGTNTPSEKLDLAGNFRFSGALMPAGAAGTAGQVLQSNGAGAAPSWVAAGSSAAWNQGGNSVSALQTLGTTSNFDLPFITNGSEAMRLTTNNKLGLGLTAIPKANIGMAKFGIEGTNASVNGPHMQFTTSADNYPLMQVLPWQHDNTFIGFDTYHNGSNWYSSTTTGGNFYITKTGGKLRMDYANVNTQGTLIPNASFLPGIVLTNTGNVGIGTATPAEKLEVAGNIEINGGDKKLIFGNLGGDPDASISLHAGANNEQQEMLFYIGNDNQPAYGPERIRMVAEEFRLQTFGDANGTLTAAENETGTNTRLLINTDGNVAVGATAFNSTNPEKLLVDAGTTNSFNVISGKGSINSYLQLNINNTSNGTVASSDVVATANNGTETTNFIDMGINSSGFTDATYPILGGANTAYLYSTGQDFVIGNGIASKNLRFFTGGFTTASERMRIDGSGNISIGTTTSRAKVTVNGDIAPLTNGASNLGTSTYKWSQVYATSGFVNSSDRRLKTNIHALPYGLKEVMNMQPVRYNWKDMADKRTKLGLIAQDIQKLVPEVVVGDEAKETLGLYYSDLVPVLINAIKEQQAQIEDLKAQNATHQATKKEIADLKKDMDALLQKMKSIESAGKK